MKCQVAFLQQSFRGDWVIGFTVAKESVPEAMSLYDKAGHRDFAVTYKPWKEKRTLTANAYFHVLVNKLAAALKISDDECKVMLVKSYGTVAESGGYPVVITLPKGEKPEAFYPYCVWIYGDSMSDSYQLMKQTHAMDSKEFARLLDGTVSECHEQGVETMPKEELERLYAQADKMHGNS